MVTPQLDGQFTAICITIPRELIRQEPAHARLHPALGHALQNVGRCLKASIHTVSDFHHTECCLISSQYLSVAEAWTFIHPRLTQALLGESLNGKAQKNCALLELEIKNNTPFAQPDILMLNPSMKEHLSNSEKMPQSSTLLMHTDRINSFISQGSLQRRSAVMAHYAHGKS